VQTREKVPGPISRKATVVIQKPFSDTLTIEHVPVVDDAPEVAVAAPQPEATPYRDALESMREELERPYQSGTLAERASAMLAPALAFLGRRQVVAGIVVLVIASLLTAVATGARGWGETDQATALGAALPTHESLPVIASAAPVAGTTRDPLSVSVPNLASIGPKPAAQRPGVAEERATPKKATDQKPDEKRIAIPKLSKGMMSRLDSVASTAANSSTRANDALDFQPAPISLASQRSSFPTGEPASTGPQRARLIGELPTPRVPAQIADVEGEVRVRFNVDTVGRPVMSTLSVVNSPNPLLTTAVRKVIPGIRFEPARTSGADSKAIGDVVEIGFRFSPRN